MRGASVPTERIIQLLSMAPALCVSCLVRVSRVPEGTMREAVADLVATNVVIEWDAVCGSQSPVLRAKAA
jgi:hypothetical protein